MRPKYVVALVTATAVAAQLSPALGAPSLSALISRVDKREARHYSSIDHRLKAAALLALDQTATTHLVSAYMTSDPSFRYWTGSVQCSLGHVVGGGMDFGNNPDSTAYQVIRSAPDHLGSGWSAAAYVGITAPTAGNPTVYAICLSQP